MSVSQNFKTNVRFYANNAGFRISYSRDYIFRSRCSTRIIASVIFAMPPTIRFTDLGIRQVPEDLIEAANAFGSTASQKLFKVQLPLATGTIMAGVNQSIMLSLSMVVTASLVGAPGLGVDVYRSVTQVNIGMGFEAGLAIVVIAIILDRITQGFHTKRK